MQLNDVTFKMAIAFAQTKFSHALAENAISISGSAPKDIEHLDFFANLVTDSYDYYANCLDTKEAFKTN